MGRRQRSSPPTPTPEELLRRLRERAPSLEPSEVATLIDIAEAVSMVLPYEEWRASTTLTRLARAVRRHSLRIDLAP